MARARGRFPSRHRASTTSFYYSDSIDSARSQPGVARGAEARRSVRVLLGDADEDAVARARLDAVVCFRYPVKRDETADGN